MPNTASFRIQDARRSKEAWADLVAATPAALIALETRKEAVRNAWLLNGIAPRSPHQTYLLLQDVVANGEPTDPRATVGRAVMDVVYRALPGDSCVPFEDAPSGITFVPDTSPAKRALFG